MKGILVIDAGGQYCHLIARTFKDLGVAVEMGQPSVTSEEASAFRGIIVSGGPESVYAEGSPMIDAKLLDLGIPILGICYGHQLLARMLGGAVERGQPEYGNAALAVHAVDPLLEGTPELQVVWMSHGDSVVAMPDDVIVSSTTKDCPVASFHHMDKAIYGLQFHPEVVHTAHGREILQNFAQICCVEPVAMTDRIATILTEIKETVGDRHVLVFVSGGVDSTVTFALCAKALRPDQLLGVYVDTGLMRKNETCDIRDSFDRLGFSDRLLIHDERNRFMTGLKGVHDPEHKREIIGRLFVESQRSVLSHLSGDDWLLGQGTIYPDMIESGPGSAAKIKTHHNRCAEIQQMIAEGRVIEPLRELYKDQVREIGYTLGIPAHFVERWPFPGPGLAIRCLCSTTVDQVQPVQDWDHYDGMSGLYDLGRVPLRSVGVQGDARTYRTTMAVKGPLNKYDLTALARQFPQDRIIAHVAGDIDLRRGEVFPAMLSEERIARLREADFVVRSAMIGHENLVWQFPVVMMPLTFSDRRGETIVLRPVASRDGMTADFVILSNAVLKRMTDGIMAIGGIDAVFIDVSDKPPATIEWE